MMTTCAVIFSEYPIPIQKKRDPRAQYALPSISPRKKGPLLSKRQASDHNEAGLHLTSLLAPHITAVRMNRPHNCIATIMLVVSAGLFFKAPRTKVSTTTITTSTVLMIASLVMHSVG